MKKTKKLVPQVLLRRMILVLLDAAIVIFSFYFALLLRADGAVEASWWPHNRALLYQNLPWIVALYLLSFLAGGLYHVLWKYAGERDLIRLGGMIAVPTGVVYFVNHFCVHGVLFDSANAMAAVLIFLLVGGSRLAWRLFLNHPIGERLRGVPNKDPNRPVMIVGAGEAGAWAINVCKTNKQYGRPVLAVDDDPAKLHQTIHGVPVKGTLEQIPELCKRYGIHSIIIAIPTLKGSKLAFTPGELLVFGGAVSYAITVVVMDIVTVDDNPLNIGVFHLFFIDFILIKHLPCNSGKNPLKPEKKMFCPNIWMLQFGCNLPCHIQRFLRLPCILLFCHIILVSFFQSIFVHNLHRSRLPVHELLLS